MTDAPGSRIPPLYTVVMLVAGALGLLAAFQLTVDKFAILENPDVKLSCSVSPFIECATNLSRPEGSVFGFPNPLIGIIGWSVVITIVMGAIAGARYRRWFWIAANIGLALALVFCIWLMTQTFFVIQRLCTWCLLTWVVTILGFVATTVLNLANGVFGEHARPAGRFLVRWSPVIVVLLYLLLAVFIQLRFDLITFFFRS